MAVSRTQQRFPDSKSSNPTTVFMLTGRTRSASVESMVNLAVCRREDSVNDIFEVTIRVDGDSELL